VVETKLGWVGLAFSDEGLRMTTLPRKTRDAAIWELAELGATEPATPEELGDLPETLTAVVDGRPAPNGARLDWTGITPFRRAVMEACMAIPPGQTESYGGLAERVGRPGAARAVGRVMATNPFPLIVPCHRVIGSTGGLHGYGGGLDMKAALLQAEGVRATR